MDRCRDGWMDGSKGGWVDGWADGLVGELVDGWIFTVLV